MYKVLLYKFTDNPEQIPGDWPSQVELTEETSVDAPWMLMTQEEYDTYMSDPTLLAAKENWNILQAEAANPTSLIITENIICPLGDEDPRKALFAFLPGSGGVPDRVRLVEGTPIQVTISIKDPTGQYTVPVTDSFALPMKGEGSATQLLFIQFVDGIATLVIDFPATGLYEITQDDINRELPPEAHFKFVGVKVYVLKLPSA